VPPELLRVELSSWVTGKFWMGRQHRKAFLNERRDDVEVEDG